MPGRAASRSGARRSIARFRSAIVVAGAVKSTKGARMKSPFEQNIVQIDITDACPHNCANCTRFNRNKAHHYFMDFVTFKKCVDSVVDYPGGLVGIMGGEPTLHPEFETFLRYYAEKIGPRYVGASKAGLKLIQDFSYYYGTALRHMRPKSRRGLFSSVSKTYAKHYEIIQDVFPEYQCLNDHAHPGRHVSLMCASNELPGISPEDKAAMIDRCWVNGTWSASMTPKGAYFCEVAGQLDMLFDAIPDDAREKNGMPKSGGVEIEPGWYKRGHDDFGDQKLWCNFCGAAMPCIKNPDAPESIADLMPLANAGRETVTPKMYAYLSQVQSPRLAKGEIEILDLDAYDPGHYRPVDMDPECYLPDGDNSARLTNIGVLRPQKIAGVITCVNYADYLADTLPLNRRHFDELIVVTDPFDAETVAVCERYGVICVQSDRAHVDGAVLSKGEMINAGISALTNPQWVLNLDADVILPFNFRRLFDTSILNPGVLYWTRRVEPNDSELPRVRKAIRTDMADFLKQEKSRFGQTYNDVSGYFQLWNVSATAIRDRESTWYPEGYKTAERVDRVFAERWPDDKQVSLPGEFQIVHLPHNKRLRGVNWNGRKTPPLPPMDWPLPVDDQYRGWRVVFRGTNPQDWNVRNIVPNHARAIRLKRLDTNEEVIAEYDNDPTKNQSTRSPGLRWIGQAFHAFGAIHLGLADVANPRLVAQKHAGTCIVDRENGNEYTGYGFGHAMLQDDRQVIVWAGEEINAEIEISLCYGCDDTLCVDKKPEPVCDHQWRPANNARGCDCVFTECRTCGLVIREKTCGLHAIGKPDYDHHFYTTLGNFRNGIPANKCVSDELAAALSRLDYPLPCGYGKTVLEIGAGIGRLAPFWMRKGYDYSAIEVSPYGFDFLTECYGVKVHLTTFEEFEATQQYGIVFSQHVLEHFKYAGAAFAKMVAITEPGGAVLILVPHGSDKYNPDHYQFFSDHTLCRWGRAVGLENCREYRVSITPKEDFIYFVGIKPKCQ